MRILALSVALAGCGSYSTYRTTRIAPKDHTQWLFGAQLAGAGYAGNANDTVGESAPQGAAPLPEFAVAARRGVTDDVELQVNTTVLPIKQAFTGSVEVGGKYRIGAIGRWSLAVGAGAQYRFAEIGGAIIEGGTISAPIIGGVDLGRHQLVFAVAGGFERLWSSGSHPVDIPFIGDSLGFLWKINARWSLLPEAGVAWSPTPNFMTEHTRLFHLGLAAMWTH